MNLYIAFARLRVRIILPSSIFLLKPVVDLAADLVKPYKINDQTVNQAFELKHGNSVRTFPMDKVSNSPFTQVRFQLIIELTK